MGKVEGRTGVQPLPDLVVSVESEGDTVVVIVQGITLRAVVADGGIVAPLVVAALEIYAVVLGESRALDIDIGHGLALPEDERISGNGVHHGSPVRIGQERGVLSVRVIIDTPEGTAVFAAVQHVAGGVPIQVAGAVGLLTGQGAGVGGAHLGSVRKRNILRGTLVGHSHIIKIVGRVQELIGVLLEVGGEFGPHADGTVTFLTPLGGNEDNAVGGTGTVDGGGTGILENFHGFDVGGIQVRHAALGAVHNHQGTSAAAHGGTAAEDDGGTGTGVTGSLLDTQTGHGTGQGLGRIGVHTGGKGLFLDGGDGVGHLGAKLAAAVGGYHRLVQKVGILLQGNSQRLSVPYNLHGGVTNGGNHQNISGLCVRLDKITVKVGNGTCGDRCALDENGSGNDGLSLSVDDLTGAAVLGKEICPPQYHREQADKQEGSSAFECFSHNEVVCWVSK